MGALTLGQKAVFHSNAQGMAQVGVLAQVAIARSLAIEQRNVSGWLNNGAYLPLKVWKTKGYDADKIEAGAREEDKKYSEQFDWWEYRVPVYSDNQSGSTIVSDKAKLGGPAKKAKKTLRDAEVGSGANIHHNL